MAVDRRIEWFRPQISHLLGLRTLGSSLTDDLLKTESALFAFKSFLDGGVDMYFIQQKLKEGVEAAILAPVQRCLAAFPAPKLAFLAAYLSLTQWQRSAPSRPTPAHI